MSTVQSFGILAKIFSDSCTRAKRREPIAALDSLLHHKKTPLSVRVGGFFRSAFRLIFCAARSTLQ
jgi:hypothetical protein